MCVQVCAHRYVCLGWVCTHVWDVGSMVGHAGVLGPQLHAYSWSMKPPHFLHQHQPHWWPCSLQAMTIICPSDAPSLFRFPQADCGQLVTPSPPSILTLRPTDHFSVRETGIGDWEPVPPTQSSAMLSAINLPGLSPPWFCRDAASPSPPEPQTLPAPAPEQGAIDFSSVK